MLEEFTGRDHGDLFLSFNGRLLFLSISRKGNGMVYPVFVTLRNISDKICLTLPTFAQPELMVNDNRFRGEDMADFPDKIYLTLRATTQERVRVISESEFHETLFSTNP